MTNGDAPTSSGDSGPAAEPGLLWSAGGADTGGGAVLRQVSGGLERPFERPVPASLKNVKGLPELETPASSSADAALDVTVTARFVAGSTLCLPAGRCWGRRRRSTSTATPPPWTHVRTPAGKRPLRGHCAVLAEMETGADAKAPVLSADLLARRSATPVRLNSSLFAEFPLRQAGPAHGKDQAWSTNAMLKKVMP